MKIKACNCASIEVEKIKSNQHDTYIEKIRPFFVSTLEERIFALLERFVYGEDVDRFQEQFSCLKNCIDKATTLGARVNENCTNHMATETVQHAIKRIIKCLIEEGVLAAFIDSIVLNNRITRICRQLDALNFQKTSLAYLNVCNFVCEKDYWIDHPFQEELGQVLSDLSVEVGTEEGFNFRKLKRSSSELSSESDIPAVYDDSQSSSSSRSQPTFLRTSISKIQFASCGCVNVVKPKKLSRLKLPCKSYDLIDSIFKVDQNFPDLCLPWIRKEFEDSINNVCSNLNDILSNVDEGTIKNLCLICEIRIGYISFKLKSLLQPSYGLKSFLFTARVATCQITPKSDWDCRNEDDMQEIQKFSECSRNHCCHPTHLSVVSEKEEELYDTDFLEVPDVLPKQDNSLDVTREPKISSADSLSCNMFISTEPGTSNNLEIPTQPEICPQPEIPCQREFSHQPGTSCPLETACQPEIPCKPKILYEPVIPSKPDLKKSLEMKEPSKGISPNLSSPRNEFGDNSKSSFLQIEMKLQDLSESLKKFATQLESNNPEDCEIDREQQSGSLDQKADCLEESGKMVPLETKDQPEIIIQDPGKTKCCQGSTDCQEKDCTQENHNILQDYEISKSSKHPQNQQGDERRKDSQIQGGEHSKSSQDHDRRNCRASQDHQCLNGKTSKNSRRSKIPRPIPCCPPSKLKGTKEKKGSFPCSQKESSCKKKDVPCMSSISKIPVLQTKSSRSSNSPETSRPSSRSRNSSVPLTSESRLDSLASRKRLTLPSQECSKISKQFPAKNSYPKTNRVVGKDFKNTSSNLTFIKVNISSTSFFRTNSPQSTNVFCPTPPERQSIPKTDQSVCTETFNSTIKLDQKVSADLLQKNEEVPNTTYVIVTNSDESVNRCDSECPCGGAFEIPEKNLVSCSCSKKFNSDYNLGASDPKLEKDQELDKSQKLQEAADSLTSWYKFLEIQNSGNCLADPGRQGNLKISRHRKAQNDHSPQRPAEVVEGKNVPEFSCLLNLQEISGFQSYPELSDLKKSENSFIGQNRPDLPNCQRAISSLEEFQECSNLQNNVENKAQHSLPVQTDLQDCNYGTYPKASNHQTRSVANRQTDLEDRNHQTGLEVTNIIVAEPDIKPDCDSCEKGKTQMKKDNIKETRGCPLISQIELRRNWIFNQNLRTVSVQTLEKKMMSKGINIDVRATKKTISKGINVIQTETKTRGTNINLLAKDSVISLETNITKIISIIDITIFQEGSRKRCRKAEEDVCRNGIWFRCPKPIQNGSSVAKGVSSSQKDPPCPHVSSPPNNFPLPNSSSLPNDDPSASRFQTTCSDTVRNCKRMNSQFNLRPNINPKTPYPSCQTTKQRIKICNCRRSKMGTIIDSWLCPKKVAKAQNFIRTICEPFSQKSIDRMKYLIRTKLCKILLEREGNGSKSFVSSERYYVSVSSEKTCSSGGEISSSRLSVTTDSLRRMERMAGGSDNPTIGCPRIGSGWEFEEKDEDCFLIRKRCGNDRGKCVMYGRQKRGGDKWGKRGNRGRGKRKCRVVEEEEERVIEEKIETMGKSRRTMGKGREGSKIGTGGIRKGEIRKGGREMEERRGIEKLESRGIEKGERKIIQNGGSGTEKEERNRGEGSRGKEKEGIGKSSGVRIVNGIEKDVEEIIQKYGGKGFRNHEKEGRRKGKRKEKGSRGKLKGVRGEVNGTRGIHEGIRAGEEKCEGEDVESGGKKEGSRRKFKGNRGSEEGIKGEEGINEEEVENTRKYKGSRGNKNLIRRMKEAQVKRKNENEKRRIDQREKNGNKTGTKECNKVSGNKSKVSGNDCRTEIITFKTCDDRKKHFISPGDIITSCHLGKRNNKIFRQRYQSSGICESDKENGCRERILHGRFNFGREGQFSGPQGKNQFNPERREKGDPFFELEQSVRSKLSEYVNLCKSAKYLIGKGSNRVSRTQILLIDR